MAGRGHFLEGEDSVLAARFTVRETEQKRGVTEPRKRAGAMRRIISQAAAIGGLGCQVRGSGSLASDAQPKMAGSIAASTGVCEAADNAAIDAKTRDR